MSRRPRLTVINNPAPAPHHTAPTAAGPAWAPGFQYDIGDTVTWATSNPVDTGEIIDFDGDDAIIHPDDLGLFLRIPVELLTFMRRDYGGAA